MFLPADSLNQQLEPALTCRHLATGAHRDGPGRFYPRCEVGSPADRARRQAVIGGERLALLRELQARFDDVARPHRERIFEAGRALKAAADASSARAELDGAVAELAEAVDRFLAEHRERVQALGMPPEALADLVREWSGGWIRALRIDERTDPGSVVYRGADLVISRPDGHRKLRFRGDIDASNLPAVASAISRAIAVPAGGGSDLEVDFELVGSCDVGGLRVLVEAAGALAPDRRLVVRSMPPSLRRAMAVVGWAEVPSLVLEPPTTGGGALRTAAP